MRGTHETSGTAYRNGSLAMVAGLVCASVAAAALRAPSPLEPVADLVMDRTPVPVAIALLLTLGPLARPLALLGALALALVFGGLLGTLYPRSVARPSDLARAGIATLLLGTVVMVVVPSGDVVVEALLAGGYIVVLTLLRQQTRYDGTRRAFLAHNGRVITGAAVLVALLYIRPAVRAFRARVSGRLLFHWGAPGPRKPGFDLPALTAEVTPPGQFYQMDEDLQQPDLDVDSWKLTIDGLVRHPLSVSFADLLAMPRRDELVTQECVSNPVGGPLISTALFSGVPVRALLARCVLDRGASAVLLRAPDGHEEALPLSVALDPNTIIAYASNGRLLEQAHGFPARALIPGIYGYKSVKWLRTIRITGDPQAGWWERRGWAALPRVQTMARIDIARHTSSGLLVAGVAFAGRRGVKAVQVRLDGGAWRVAALHTPPLSPLTWLQWRIIIAPRDLASKAGQTITVQARAVDLAGHVQTVRDHQQQPSGATGYHTIQIGV